MRAVVLVGGETSAPREAAGVFPTALVAVGGGRPVIEIVLRQLARAGCDHATVAGGRAAVEPVRARVRDGAPLGLRVDYAVEKRPLGTVGPVVRLRDLPDSFLVVPGDVLFDLALRRLFARHVRRGAAVTVVARNTTMQARHSVLEVDDEGRLRGVLDKPGWRFLGRLGVWAMRREALEGLVPGTPYPIDVLLLDLLLAEKRVDVERTTGVWLDLGVREERERAEATWSTLRARLDPP